MLPVGSRIAVVAPAGIFDSGRLARSVRIVEGWGYDVVEGTNLRAQHRYTAGTREQRHADLVWALTAPDIQAVWFARGGYGTVHHLPHIPWDTIDDRVVLGFSDATSLLNALAMQQVALPVHAPVLHALVGHVDDASTSAVQDLLFEERSSVLPGKHLGGPREVVEAPVVGGNLRVLASLAGTQWALQAQGRILLLEDVNDPPYKLDRAITQLHHSGALDGVVGIALGQFVDCWLPDDADWTLDEVLVDLLEPLGVPIVGHLPVGHGAQNHPWRVGAPARLHSEGLDVG